MLNLEEEDNGHIDRPDDDRCPYCKLTDCYGQCAMYQDEDHPNKPIKKRHIDTEEADRHDDYWQGNIDAELYHDDIGDR